MAKIKVAIGIPTYNSSARAPNLITSIFTFTDFPRDDYKVVVLDDGTPNKSVVDELEVFTEHWDIPLIRNETNEGIPASWNKLAKFYDTEMVVLLNDDVVVCSGEWLRVGVYFLENNEMIGSVGWPLVQIDPSTGQIFGSYFPTDPDEQDILRAKVEQSWGDKPGRVGSPVGCAFMFLKDVGMQVKNPEDGSEIFCEALGSFHEELLWNFRLYELGYSSYMLNWPPLEHHHSRTFAENPELSWMPWTDKYFSKEAFLEKVDKSRHYSPDWKLLVRKRIEEEGMVDRMGFSRYLFAKIYGVLDHYDAPQIPVHKRLVDTVKSRKIKWLDREIREQEVTI
jgi:glycosyltransferase involved in cell wall biosynthesis